MHCRVGNLFEVYREPFKTVLTVYKWLENENDVWSFRTILGFYVEYMYLGYCMIGLAQNHHVIKY